MGEHEQMVMVLTEAQTVNIVRQAGNSMKNGLVAHQIKVIIPKVPRDTLAPEAARGMLTPLHLQHLFGQRQA